MHQKSIGRHCRENIFYIAIVNLNSKISVIRSTVENLLCDQPLCKTVRIIITLNMPENSGFETFLICRWPVDTGVITIEK